ncbi:MAG: PilN domain-containing protein [Phycisphaeraceae bacterium]|nr:PilN domain-containing protein [Phycisphaeraceae bacterium]
MTQFHRSKERPTNRSGGACLGIAHTDGQTSFVVVVPGSTPDTWRVAETRRVAAAPETVARELAESHKPLRIVRVTSARACVVRCGRLGEGEADEVLGASELFAEANLPSSSKPHRRGYGVFTGPEGMPSVMATAWMEPAEPPYFLSQKDQRDQREGWASPAAALRALCGDGECTALFADEQGGAASVVMDVPAGVWARVLLLPKDGTWESSLDSGLQECAAAAGVSMVPPLEGGRRVRLDSDSAARLARRVEAMPNQKTWLDDFGLALGAAMLATEPGTAQLCRMRSVAEAVHVAPWIRYCEWISEPRRAIAVAAVATVCMLAVPWAVAFTRYKVLDARVEPIESGKAGKDETERLAAMYAQLEVSRRPMTKLLADLSAATPVGIVATDVRLSPDQGLAIQGVAERADLVNTFQANLGKIRIFRDVKVNRVASTQGGEVDFNISATIPAATAHIPVTPIEDFAAIPLAVRLYGENALNAPAASDPPAGASTPRTNGRTTPPRATRQPADETPSVRPSAASGPPPAVSDEDIAKMTFMAATQGWTQRKSYVQQNPGLDAQTKARLEDEEAKMRARAAAARSGGGGS